MTNTFKPAGAALAAVVAGLSAPTTMASEAPDLSAAESPMQQAAALARGLASMTASEPMGGEQPNSALLDVPLAGLGGEVGHG